MVQPGTPPELLNKGNKGDKGGKGGGGGYAGGYAGGRGGGGGYGGTGGWVWQQGRGGGKTGKGKGKDLDGRGGWFNKCQRLCEAVLRQDNEEAWALAREHYAGPDAHLAAL